ncbi:MAG TPA: NADH-quinone oxidoreductase subunit N [Holophagaceae bacterium]|nr:NADH-quinone oxidoreductase subunit N [Holophagaceae bacterium]
MMAKNFAALWPLLFPAVGACFLPLASLDREHDTAKWIRAVVYGIALLALGGSFYYLASLWATGAQPEFEALRMDRLAQFAGIFITIAGMLTVMQAWDHFQQEGWVKAETLSLLLFSVTGMMLFTATSNLLLMFLGLELLSLPLYALVATVRTRPEAPEGAMKYYLTGAVASSCFLMGSVLIYGMTGTLDLSAALAAKSGADPLFLAGVALLLLGFLFKTSAVPFHQWTPDAYQASPHPVAGFMSVATKGAAFIALMRVFPGALSGGAAGPKAQEVFAILAVLTLVIGNLTALVQTDAKRMLAYSAISHAGYLLLGFVAGTPAAMTGVLFYLAIYLAMNMGAFGLFTAFGLVGSDTSYDALRGLGWKRPMMGLCAAICMLSLAGIPPFGGFFGKYIIFKELIATGHVSLAVLGVLASLVSLYYYLRFVVALFIQAPSEALERKRAEQPLAPSTLAGASVLVAAFIVVMGGFAQGLLVPGFAARAVGDWLKLLR